MDITFLVGNGFDLSLGYRTSYRDFYEYYLGQPAPSEYDNAISRLKSSIKYDLESGSKNWADFEIGLGKFSQEYDTENVNDYVAAFSDAFQKLHDYLSGLPRSTAINSISEKQWGIIRMRLCFFFQDAKPQEVTEFSNLKTSEQANGWGATFHFVSFNYTNYLDEYVTKMAQEPLEIWKRGSEDKKHVLDSNILHVHGPLDDYPIIGVSNKEQILNDAFRSNDYLCRTLVKPNIVTEIQSHRYSDMNTTIRKSRILCLWGLSLGESDKHWWKFIVDWLKSEQNRSIFIFEHTNNPPSKIIVSDFYTKRREVAYRLLNCSTISENEKNSLLARIHVIFNTEKVLVFPTTIDPKQ